MITKFANIPNLRELQASREDHFQAADKLVRAARESGKDLAGADLKQYEGHIAELTTLDKEIKRLSAYGAAPINGSQFQQANEPSGWVDPRSGQPVLVLRPDQRMVDLNTYGEQEPLSMGKYLHGIVTGKWSGAEREMRAMSEGSLGGGGYLLPSPLSSNIIDKVRNASVVVRSGANTVPMENSTLSIARVAGDITPGWHTEAAAIATSDMAFEKVTFTAQTLAALTTFSVELFEDTSNLDVLISQALGKVLAIELDRACLLGSGTAPEPRGVRNQANVVVDSTTFGTDGAAISTTTPTGAVAWDWVSKQISALWGVNEAPNAVIYSARTAGELDLLRASTGEVLPPPGSVANLQRLFTNSIPNNLTQGANHDASEAFVGDFTQALIGMRHGIVLELSRSAIVGAPAVSMFSTLQIALRVYLRADFQLARPAAFRVVTGIR